MAVENYLPISRLNQYIYCPRRFWLVYVEQSMLIDAQMLEGILQHSNVHAQSNTTKHATAVPVCSERLGLIGVLDALEHTADGLVVVEHKRGSTRQWDNDQLQVAAQAVAYEDMTGQPVAFGSIFSWQSRRRYRFPITPELRNMVEQVAAAMRQIIAAGKRPAPISQAPKCKGCSVREVCQPALIRKLRKE